MNPYISIVCAWYNRADYIKDTVDSLLAQDFDRYEIIIVNDGSPDPRVREILESYADTRLIIVHQANTGFVGAIRAAITHARGEFIAIQGAGDVSLPDRIRAQHQFMVSNPDFGIVGCRRYAVTVDRSVYGEKSIKGKAGEHSIDRLLYGENPFTQGEVMFRKAIYEKVGGYRSFFKFAQDRDLWIRMAPFTKLYVLDEVLYERRNFVEDGVSTNKSKLVLQQALSSFARQCHHDRLAYGCDFIEKYGAHGGLFRRSSPYFAKALSKLALQSLHSGAKDEAVHLSRQALAERKTVLSVAAFLIIWLADKSQLCSSFFQMLLSWHPGAREWHSKK